MHRTVADSSWSYGPDGNYRFVSCRKFMGLSSVVGDTVCKRLVFGMVAIVSTSVIAQSPGNPRTASLRNGLSFRRA
ncbi:MAG: hypothetical protein Ct9H300mP25_14010 [Acidobacteriota bacterium]|nr:MAG: hypothetical protein Ct9H300mP25_14010 [Acidobacteriota bacterium]